MSQQTAIEWTDLSWNPVHGCSIVSTECRHCYAQTLSLRHGQTKLPWTPANAAENVILKPHKLREPLSNTKDWRGLGAAAAAAGKTDGKLVFVNSMSDLFHEQIPNEYIAAVFGVMAVADRHTFQILTKRPDRALAWFEWFDNEIRETECHDQPAEAAVRRAREHVDILKLFEGGEHWPLPNVWVGVSVGNHHFNHRARLLRDIPAAVRFISAEPLLGPLVPKVAGTFNNPVAWWPDGRDTPCVPYDGIELTGIDWLIAGGESGPDHRPINPEWVRDLREHCEVLDVAFFFKQWGGHTPKAGGRELDGRTWSEFPQATGVAS